MASNIGFIGLGNMGYPMAAHLRKKMPKSATLYVNDVSRSVCERFVQSYCDFGPIEIVTSARDAASNSQTLFSIVPNAHIVRQIYLDSKNGVINASPNPNRIMLECSTIDIACTREIGRAIKEAGIGIYVDAPVSGGSMGAEAGTIAFLIGYEGNENSDPIVRHLKDTCSWMGLPDRVFFCGALGTGLAAKIANNYISTSTTLLIAEAMAIGLRHGIDKKTLFDCIKVSTGNSWVFETVNPVPGCVPSAPASDNFRPGFKPFMVVKDITLGVDAARKVGVDPSMGMMCLQAFQKAAEDPRTKDLDCSSVWLHVNDELK